MKFIEGLSMMNLPILYTYAAVALGGAIGAMGRFYVTTLFNKGYPWGTLLVNVVGSLALGYIAALFEKYIIHPNWRLVLMVGFCGGLTTFSSFAMDFFNFIEQGELLKGLIYVILSITMAFLLFAAGYYGAR